MTYNIRRQLMDTQDRLFQLNLSIEVANFHMCKNQFIVILDSLLIYDLKIQISFLEQILIQRIMKQFR